MSAAAEDPFAAARSSVRAASEALEHLERSLRAAGFAEGIPAYERMAEVLVAQHLWQAPHDESLRTSFDALGRTARRVFGLLHPYAVVMRRLAVLAPEEPESAEDAADEMPRNRTTVLAEVQRRGRRGASVDAVVRSSGLPSSTVEAALTSLVDDGTVSVRGRGAARLYSPARTGR